jgi:hypothetical protein
MKGLVFTTFYAFCESNFGEDVLEDIIDGAALPHGGAYTSVGTYPFEEMVALVVSTVKLTGRTMPAILEAFGEYCFASWVSQAPGRFEGKALFDVLAGIDDFHESEVRKLYPDAELPSFKVASRDARRLVLDYHSCKPLADLACGVIKGASRHLATPVTIRHAQQTGPGGAFVRFDIERTH